jgi:hypothetical protein
MSCSQNEFCFEVVGLDGETHSISAAADCTLNDMSHTIRSVCGKSTFRLLADQGDLFERFDPEQCVGLLGLENGSSVTLVDEGLDDIQVRFLMLMRASTSMKRMNIDFDTSKGHTDARNAIVSEIVKRSAAHEHLDRSALIRAVQQEYHDGQHSSGNNHDEWLGAYFPAQRGVLQE